MTLHMENQRGNEPSQASGFARLLMLGTRILGFGFAVFFLISFVQWMQTDSARYFYIGLDGMQTHLLLILFLMACAGLLAWWRRPGWRTLGAVAAGTLMLLTGLSQIVRLESFHGNRTPRFVWRWEPTAEEKFHTYLASHHGHTRASGALNLFSQTDRDFPGFLARRATQLSPRLD
jgi:hypothetical protein